MADSASAETSPSVVAAGVAPDPSLMWAEFAGRLRSFVARRAPAGIEPDDVVQEVFVRVVRHLPSLRDAERIDAWLFQIARNALRDAMRARQRRDARADPLELDIPAETDTEDVRAAEAELAPCLTPMVERLDEPYRSAIQLTSVQGLTQTEAAKRVGVSVSGMKSRVQRARGQLKEMLLRCCEVHIDRRRGVSDYRPRESAACSTPNHGSASDGRCGCSPSGEPAPASIVDPQRLPE